MDRAWVYLVTGGCGFIGEKIVELLSQQDYIKEVRVFDSVAREEVEKFSTATTRVTVMKGDIRDYNLLLAAMRGVHVVIHTAAVVDYRNTVPFWEMRAVNVGGTENVLRACFALNIPYVVYTSSIAAVGPNTSHEPMIRGTEDTKYSGEVELPYGKTKAMAEKLVFEANGKKLCNGAKLRACIIRANTVYGEKATFLQELYLSAKARNGVLNYLEPENNERNYTYVGNVAWMHVLAARNLQLKPDLLAGQVYYSYDDTPTRKGFLIRHQLLSSMDPSVQLGSHIPYWKMWLMIQLHRIIKIILYPFWKPQPFLNLSLLNMIVTTFSYETDKASRHFGYKPLFPWKESKHRTAQWLKAAAGNLEPPQLNEKKN
ncbi:3 beta-hydroxysteroid dehydrogenase type 7-like [Apus apus]|uniref:3 beta-hydroxysteroid dehydrogenase type 7-like n=1 Tax=Apus apus TaxID=8895 RepID=UPI0021F891B3|nr:3 beta-hydroxysteroid dehydrogenase type 7-like [Apus apus]XP_051491972.1 3 beta-hydroxysteroid dehydrogenase type 7-like [Apus apus]